MSNMRFKNRPSHLLVRICLEILNKFKKSSSQRMPDSNSSGLTVVLKKSSYRWHWSFILCYPSRSQLSRKVDEKHHEPSSAQLGSVTCRDTKVNWILSDLIWISSQRMIHTLLEIQIASLAKFQTYPESSQKLSSAEVGNIFHLCKSPCPERTCNGRTFCWTKWNSRNSIHEHRLIPHKC